MCRSLFGNNTPHLPFVELITLCYRPIFLAQIMLVLFVCCSIFNDRCGPRFSRQPAYYITFISPCQHFFSGFEKIFYLSGGGITGEKNAPEFGWNILRDQIPRNKFRGSAELSGGVVLKSVLLTKQTQNDIIDTNKSRLSSPILFPSLTD